MPQQAQVFDQYSLLVRDKRCEGCKFAGSDPDGGYCAHESSMKVSGGFGRSWNAATLDEKLCGPTKRYFEPMDLKRARALGTAR